MKYPSNFTGELIALKHIIKYADIDEKENQINIYSDSLTTLKILSSQAAINLY